MMTVQGLFRGQLAADSLQARALLDLTLRSYSPWQAANLSPQSSL